MDSESAYRKEREEHARNLRVEQLKAHIIMKLDKMTDNNLELASSLINNVELVRGALKLIDDLQDSRYLKTRDYE